MLRSAWAARLGINAAFAMALCAAAPGAAAGETPDHEMCASPQSSCGGALPVACLRSLDPNGSLVAPARCGEAMLLYRACLVRIEAVCARTDDKPPPPAPKDPPAHPISYAIERVGPASVGLVAADDESGFLYDAGRFSAAEATIHANKDLNGDGWSDALIALSSEERRRYVVVAARPNGVFERIPLKVEGDPEPPEIAWTGAEWRLRFEIRSDAAAATVLDLAVDGVKAKILDKRIATEARALAELRSRDVDPAAPGILRADIDLDGQEDKLICAYWARWDRLQCSAELSAKGKAAVDRACKRIGVLEAEADGVRELVCDADRRLYFDADAGRFLSRDEG